MKKTEEIPDSFISKIMGALTVNPSLRTKSEILQWFEEFNMPINKKSDRAVEKFLKRKSQTS